MKRLPSEFTSPLPPLARPAVLVNMTAMHVCVDAGRSEFRYGFADMDAGADVMAGVDASDTKILMQHLATALDELLGDDESDDEQIHLLISERPGISRDEREAMATAIFSDKRVDSLWMVAAPLLALFNAGKDTCVVVDVGETAAYVLPIFQGHPLHDAATCHPIAGGSSGGDLSSCAVLFEQTANGGGGDGLHDAILRTVQLADVSVRGALLANIVLVGGGSLLPGCVERLERELAVALRKRGAPWSPSVVANADRRIAAWLGASLLTAMPSAQARFVSRAEYASDPSLIQERCASLPCLDLAALEARQRVIAARGWAEAEEAKTRSLREHREAAKRAREWWTEQAPVGGVRERYAQRTLQQTVVKSLWRRSLEGLTGSSARALRLMAGDRHASADERLIQRATHLLYAEWAVSAMNHGAVAVDDNQIRLHWQRRASRNAWSRWGHLRARVGEAKRTERSAVGAWRAASANAAMRRWSAWWSGIRASQWMAANAHQYNLTAIFHALRGRARARRTAAHRGRLARRAQLRSALRALCTRASGVKRQRHLSRVAVSTPALTNLRKRALMRALTPWATRMQLARAVLRATKRLLRKRLHRYLVEWRANAKYVRFVWKVRLRRTAARLRKGKKDETRTSLRRGLLHFRQYYERRVIEWRVGRVRDRVRDRRVRRLLVASVGHWANEAARRKSRQRWMQRQLHYMREVKHVLSESGDGKRLVRLLSLGVNAPSEDALRAGRDSIRRSNEALERALRRESKAFSPSVGEETLKHVTRVLSPGIDSYLADVLYDRRDEVLRRELLRP